MTRITKYLNIEVNRTVRRGARYFRLIQQWVNRGELFDRRLSHGRSDPDFSTKPITLHGEVVGMAGDGWRGGSGEWRGNSG
jgi:hypothetical protein